VVPPLSEPQNSQFLRPGIVGIVGDCGDRYHNYCYGVNDEGRIVVSVPNGTSLSRKATFPFGTGDSQSGVVFHLAPDGAGF
jgi:hypothetical protein